MIDIFKTYGNHEIKITKDHHMSTEEVSFTLEELYQAIKNRLMNDLKVKINNVPFISEHGDRVEQMFNGDLGELIEEWPEVTDEEC